MGFDMPISTCLEYLLFVVLDGPRVPFEFNGLGEPVGGVY